jgi:hypothetical protein
VRLGRAPARPSCAHCTALYIYVAAGKRALTSLLTREEGGARGDAPKRLLPLLLQKLSSSHQGRTVLDSNPGIPRALGIHGEHHPQ